MKKPCSWSVVLVLLSGAWVSACGEGVDAPFTPDTRSERQSATEAGYAVIPLHPNGGATLKAGQTVTLEWDLLAGAGDRLLADAVRLELYKGGRHYATIAESLPLRQWNYAWTIPANVTSGSSYQLRLSSVSDPSLVSYGDVFNLDGPGCDFRFEVESLYVAKDQRTATYNYEGKLELAGHFRADSVSTSRFPSTGELSMSQGATLPVGLFIKDVQVLEPLILVSVGAFMMEIEHGAQGSTDTGTASDFMSVGCMLATETKNLYVTLSDDSALETEGRVDVKLRATRL